MNPTKQNWKQRLYGSYVSSKQAGANIQSDASPFRQVAPYIRQLIRNHVPRDKSLRIVDLACGHGSHLYFLKQAGYSNIAGIDISSEQVQLAHQLGIDEVVEGDLLQFLANEKQDADVVLLIDIIEHLERQDVFELMDAVMERLNPGGRVIIHVPNAEGLYGMRIRYGDFTHELAFTPRSIKQVLTTLGFRNVECFEDQPIAHGLASSIRRVIWKIGTLPHRLLLTAETGSRHFILSQNMLVVAEK
ncbi:dTDP-3-amino-3,6-dideoxy-alpha-D-glucopyranose N,N-dimethyltransferase [Rubripirellula tenax]|uniref:dTDP-3-amino-3,6-dideoxy-alpha-D-glucopyranose N,N-dimethyltransferase n=1 Tax=Rubripirellula tenax TaxID=2528015 RepID=A0A5C6EJS0_9BACT|nr:class I SAM-dependent methyltransferase [Rubripirellula tenax]TWU47529.1 dTDP-3-amino-3,6-dideoxy-alpha-D-glucopyranose N,N-dimethyltransferase [Rubripirellula tenax]